MIRWERARAVRGRLHDAGRRRQRRAVRRRSTSAARGDDPARVAENRRLACDALGLDAARLSVNRQRHTPAVHRAVAGRADEPGDGLWTDEPGLPMLALAADCLPIAVATHGRRPPRSPCSTPAGAASPRGSSRPACGRSATARTAAVVGPAVGPCCYEVGPEVSARFDADLTRGRDPRPVDGGRACAAPRRRRRGRARRPLHALQPGALLLAPPQRPGRAACRA